MARPGATPDLNAAVTADVDAAVPAHPNLRLIGWAAKESKASAAVAAFDIVHGATGSGGDAIIPIALNPDETAREWYGPEGGILCPAGISIQHVAGTFDCTLFFKKEDA